MFFPRTALCEVSSPLELVFLVLTYLMGKMYLRTLIFRPLSFSREHYKLAKTSQDLFVRNANSITLNIIFKI